jgi:hypothetical protein
MDQSFWAGIAAACITATGAITGATLAADINRNAQRKLDEINRREDSYKNFVDIIRRGDGPGTVFLSPASSRIKEIVNHYRETGLSAEDLKLLNREMEEEIARDREPYEKRNDVIVRLRKISFVFLVSTVIILITAGIASAMVGVVFPDSRPGKWIRHIFSHSMSHSARPSASATPLVTPSLSLTPASLPTPTPTFSQGASPSAATTSVPSAAPHESEAPSSPDTDATPVSGSSALLPPDCGSGNGITCVSKIGSGVARTVSKAAQTCVADPAQGILGTDLAGLLPNVVGSVTKCATGAVAAVIPTPLPSPSATAIDSSTREP